jgi:hypothetical protein
MPTPRSAAFKATALLSSFLLAGAFLYYRATGNTWLQTHAAEGASADAGDPEALLGSSKSGPVFHPAQVQFSNDKLQFAAAPATHPTTPVTPASAPTADRSTLMYSSKSGAVFTPAPGAKAPAPPAQPATQPPAPNAPAPSKK